MQGTFSGGTAASALEIMGPLREGRITHDIRLQVEPAPRDRTVTIATGTVGRDASTGWWVVPLPTIDPLIVAQSARQLPRYGPAFTYSHFLASESPAGHRGDARWHRRAGRGGPDPGRPPGTGPAAAVGERPERPHSASKAWFRVRFVGEGGGRRW